MTEENDLPIRLPDRRCWPFMTLLSLLSAVFGFLIAVRPPAYRGNGDAVPDTVIVTSVRFDTVRIEQPAAVAKMPVDTIWIHDFATVAVHDTVYVKLPKEERVYSDSLYKAQVSGYMPSLDWIEVYPRTVTQTRTVAKKPGRWSLGIQAGYGATKDRLSPYIGVGVGYSLLSW